MKAILIVLLVSFGMVAGVYAGEHVSGAKTKTKGYVSKGKPVVRHIHVSGTKTKK